MSREIKFRAWKMHNGKMSRCIYTPVSFMHYVQTHLNEPVMKHPGENDIRNFMPDADIIEQYTGLKDKYGKEIYEGDIVKIWNNNHSGDALGGGHAIEGHWFPMVREVKMDTRGIYVEYPWYMLLRNFADIEVIGNIHENTELLGGE